MALTLETVSPELPGPSAISPTSPDQGRDLFEGAAAKPQRHHPAGPGLDVAPERLGNAQAENGVPNNAFDDEDGERPLNERAGKSSPPSSLLGDDDRLRALADVDLGGDRLGGKIGRLRALRVRRLKLGFVGVDQAR